VDASSLAAQGGVAPRSCANDGGAVIRRTAEHVGLQPVDWWASSDARPLDLSPYLSPPFQKELMMVSRKLHILDNGMRATSTTSMAFWGAALGTLGPQPPHPEQPQSEWGVQQYSATQSGASCPEPSNGVSSSRAVWREHQIHTPECCEAGSHEGGHHLWHL